MIIKINKKQYKILLFHHVIPFGIERVVSSMNNEPSQDNVMIAGTQLNGMVAIVTGGHKGIGYCIAKRLIQDGAKVIITGRNKAQLEKAVKTLGEMNASCIDWDISKTSEHEGKFKEAMSKYGRIDILVNNAGVTTDRKDRVGFEDMDAVHIKYVHGINAIGTSGMCKTFASIVKEGTILNIISNTGVRPAQDAYFTSKWALYSFTKAFSEELRNFNSDVTINGICPGPIKTDMSFCKGTSLFRKEIPNRRIGLPEEIAELAFVQISAGLHGTSGMISVCDGGETLN